MVTMMRTRRTADAAKWAELFGKAVREGVEVRQTGSGLWIATSGTDRTAAYVVELRECECPGHTYHGFCEHRALLAWTLGVLTLGRDTGPDPELPTPAAPAGRAAGLSPAKVVMLKADAMTRHPLSGTPLVNVDMGEVIADAAWRPAPFFMVVLGVGLGAAVASRRGGHPDTTPRAGAYPLRLARPYS